MRLLADLHTHTVASGHAFSTVTELATAASAKGLELIAFTDHGPSVPGGAHFWYFWNTKVLPPRIAGVRVLRGCEANVADTDSGLDLPDEVLGGLDVVAVGFHPLTGFDELDRARNTHALVRAMANPLVDIVTHPGNAAEFPLEAAEIVAAAVQYGVALELNNHSFDPRSGRSAGRATEREFAIAARDAGVWISLGSDAHYHDQVGDLAHALVVVEEIGFPHDRIVNRDEASVLAFLNGRRTAAGRPLVGAIPEVRP
jgi:putative hydrolase